MDEHIAKTLSTDKDISGSSPRGGNPHSGNYERWFASLQHCTSHLQLLAPLLRVGLTTMDQQFDIPIGRPKIELFLMGRHAPGVPANVHDRSVLVLAS